jgi:hypothetical protein
VIETLTGAAVALLVAGAGGYLPYALRRAVYPFVEVDLDLTGLGSRSGVTEIVLAVHNVGPGSGDVSRIRGRVSYRLPGESGVREDGVEPDLAAFVQPAGDALVEPDRSWFWFSRSPDLERSFIQPGVTHRYRKPVAVPVDAVAVHAWVAFDYRLRVGRVAWALAGRFMERPPSRTVPFNVRRTFFPPS